MFEADIILVQEPLTDAVSKCTKHTYDTSSLDLLRAGTPDLEP